MNLSPMKKDNNPKKWKRNSSAQCRNMIQFDSIQSEQKIRKIWFGSSKESKEKQKHVKDLSQFGETTLNNNWFDFNKKKKIDSVLAKKEKKSMWKILTGLKRSPHPTIKKNYHVAKLGKMIDKNIGIDRLVRLWFNNNIIVS